MILNTLMVDVGIPTNLFIVNHMNNTSICDIKRIVIEGDGYSCTDSYYVPIEIAKKMEQTLREIEKIGHGHGHGFGYTCADMAKKCLEKIQNTEY